MRRSCRTQNGRRNSSRPNYANEAGTTDSVMGRNGINIRTGVRLALIVGLSRLNMARQSDNGRFGANSGDFDRDVKCDKFRTKIFTVEFLRMTGIRSSEIRRDRSLPCRSTISMVSRVFHEIARYT